MKEPDEPPPEVLEYQTQERKRSRNPYILITVIVVLGVLFGAFFLFSARWNDQPATVLPIQPAPTSVPAK